MSRSLPDFVSQFYVFCSGWTAAGRGSRASELLIKIIARAIYMAWECRRVIAFYFFAVEACAFKAWSRSLPGFGAL